MSVLDENATQNDRLKSWMYIARRPVGATLFEKISLLSPYTWWRIAVFRNVNDFIPVLATSASALVLPLMIHHVVHRVVRSRNGTEMSKASTSSLTTYLFSPYAMAFWYKAGCKLHRVISDVVQLYNMRSQANPSAWKCLAERITASRAYRTKNYDVYLPPSSLKDVLPILFLPGAYVQHEAYAELTSMLSDAGYLVVVVSLEPMRLADCYLSRSNVFELRIIQTRVERHHADILKADTRGSDWIIAGHSMGSLAATKLVQPLGISKVLMFGSAPFINYMGDLSETPNCKVQVIQGSDDNIIEEFATPELISEFWRRLPVDSQKTCHVIQGGTHCGFADYLPCWKEEHGSITSTEQHSEAVRVAVDFLRTN